MRILSCSLFALLLVAPACDTDKKDKKVDDAAAKKANEEAEEAKRIEQRRQEREAKAAAEKKAEEDRQAAIEALCVVPEDAKKPKKLAQACEAAGDAQIEFLKRAFADQPEKLEGVEKNAAMQKAQLLKSCSTMEVALGLKNAFDNAPKDYGPWISGIIGTCVQKLGPSTPPPGAGGAVPPKPR